MQKLIVFACWVFLAAGSASAQQEKIRFVVRPYLQYATQHSMRILWETSENATTGVEYGPARMNAAAADLSHRVSIPGTRTMHEVELTGLQTETNYFYRVSSILSGGDTLTSEIIPFQTAVGDSSAFAFVVFGDSQERPAAWGNITRLAERERPNFALHAGDLVDLGYIKKDWVDEFFAPAHSFMKKIPLYSILGNHEHDASWYYRYLSNPEPEYRYHFRYGNAEFFMVDTDQPLQPGSEVYDWLEQSLARSTATWKFVVHHYAPYSSDEDDYGDTKHAGSLLGDEDVLSLVPLYEKYGVDIVFYGHIHLYERSWPIYRNKVVENSGVVYITTGGAGGDTESAAPTRSWFTNTVRTTHHFCYCTINGSHLQFKAIDEAGQLFDYFDIYGSRKNKAPIDLAPAAPVFLSQRRIFADTMYIAISAALPGETIRYTLDGTEPSANAMRYGKPLLVDRTTNIKIASFSKYGRSRVNEAAFVLQEPYPATTLANARPGLQYCYFTGMIEDSDPEKFMHVAMASQGVAAGPDPALIPHRRQFWGAVYDGFIHVPADGYYQFDGHADHIFRLHLENRLLIEELDQETNFRTEIYLQRGYHPIKIEYYNRRADRAFMEFYYSGPGIKRQPVPDSLYFIK